MPKYSIQSRSRPISDIVNSDFMVQWLEHNTNTAIVVCSESMILKCSQIRGFEFEFKEISKEGSEDHFVK